MIHSVETYEALAQARDALRLELLALSSLDDDLALWAKAWTAAQVHRRALMQRIARLQARVRGQQEAMSEAAAAQELAERQEVPAIPGGLSAACEGGS